MRRREFIAGLGGAAAWPVALHAQQRIPVIGFLGSASAPLFSGQLQAFRQGLGEVGYVEGQSIIIDNRWAEGRYDRLPELAADLVRRNVTAIVTSGGAPPALAAKAATTTIPILFVTGSDPVETGIVTNLRRPEANVTGVTSLNIEMGRKRLQLVHELMPAATIVVALVNPSSPTAEAQSKDMQSAAEQLGLKIHILQASSEQDLTAVFALLNRFQANALVISTDAFFISERVQLAHLAVLHKVPAVFEFRDFASAGGLMSYGANFAETYRLVGNYAGRVLKGDRPSELPVQQSTKVELIINLKTATALGLAVPLTLLGRADEVIE
jgi:putative ABC transport system substrate-binding protein